MKDVQKLCSAVPDAKACQCFPVVEDLPDDPEWEKVERAFGEAASKNLRPPEF